MRTRLRSRRARFLTSASAAALRLALTAAAALSPARAMADHVTLRNGDSLTGRIASTSATSLTMETDLAGRVAVPWSAVTAVTPAGAVPRGVTLGGNHTASADGYTWHGTVNAGVNVSRGNTETRSLSTTGVATHIGPHDRLGLFGAHLSSSVGSGVDAVTTGRSTRGGVRYDHDLRPPLYGFASFDAENDLLQLLDLRTVAGGGAGAHLLNTGTTQANVFAGVSYARDAYTDVTTTASDTTASTTTSGSPVTTPGKGGTPPGQGGTPPGQARVTLTRGGAPPSVVRTSLSRHEGEFLAGQDVTRQLSGSLGVSESLTVFPALSNFSDYRVSFDVSLWAQVASWLQWNASVSDRYLRIPPAGGAVRNDTYLWTGLGITFGRGGGGAYTGTDSRRTR